MCATSSTTRSWSWPPDAPPPSDQGGEDKPGRVDPDTLPKNVPEHSTELVIIARFRARNEPGCLEMGAYASTRDPRLFFIHSQWRDEEAFDAHAQLPNTLQFVEQMERLIDHPFDVSRTRAIA